MRREAGALLSGDWKSVSYPAFPALHRDKQIDLLTEKPLIQVGSVWCKPSPECGSCRARPSPYLKPINPQDLIGRVYLVLTLFILVMRSLTLIH